MKEAIQDGLILGIGLFISVFFIMLVFRVLSKAVERSEFFHNLGELLYSVYQWLRKDRK